MPRRNDIQSVMVLGSGPIVIGQACEFDYSGTQGCKALKEEGCRVILLNSNPATVMTDPGFSDRTYIEPLNIHMASAVVRKERPDALLPTLGGQTALNLAMELHRSGLLEECGVRMIGARPEAIELAENRQKFHAAMLQAGLDLPRSGRAASVADAVKMVKNLGFPAIIRPSYTLGGTGGGIAYNLEEFKTMARRGIEASPIGEILVEESVLGWKEIELEVVRDSADNAVVICGIENLDPMGIHTGDSITVAPIQTLSDREYQALRDDALRVVRAVGVDTGGCNIQFAVHPQSGRRVVIEMNPRVSRSSALASKATGYPIARVATKLALGYHLGELRNDITGTSACFEPAVDYCVVKAPRFNYEKFDGSEPVLGLQMHSVGETMAIGGNFREALQKALRGLEIGLSGLEAPPENTQIVPLSRQERLSILRDELPQASPERLLLVYEAMQLGMDPEEAHSLTGIDLWFLLQIRHILDTERRIGEVVPPLLREMRDEDGKRPPESADGRTKGASRAELRRALRHIKAQGFSDARIAALARQALFFAGEEAFVDEADIRRLRAYLDVHPAFRSVDTCAGEYAVLTPYYYSTYDAEQGERLPPSGKNGQVPLAAPGGAVPLRKVMILGGGPNRIGQGVEFDYCCVQAAFALKEAGITSIMVNSNPETVSTDYDTADVLYFEPLTVEDILAICRVEQPDGLIVQFGGQTPLNLASALEKEGIPIIGTSPSGIALAEDRDSFGRLMRSLGVPQPPSGMAHNEESACRIAKDIGYPVMVRPSFVLGGRAMRVIQDESSLREYVGAKYTGACLQENSPILVDKFLEDAVEVDVDAVVDGKTVTIAAIMEHIEQAGIHSGDSCCSIPTHTLSTAVLERIRENTRRIGLALGTVGLLNIQFAVRDEEVHILEANPRASRTVPFVSKATGVPVARIATMVMCGSTLAETGFVCEPAPVYHAMKEAVLPFERFPGAEIGLGPEMHSTGEVMGLDKSFGMAFLKAQSAAGTPIPFSGNIVLSVTDRDKQALVHLAARLEKLGFRLYATPGTKRVLEEHGIATELVVKIGPRRPHLLDFMRNGEVNLLVNTVSGSKSARDATRLRAEALARHVTTLTTIAALRAAVEGVEARQISMRSVAPLQEYYALQANPFVVTEPYEP
ncbi:carbamoyl-phosphate synthase large subunit [Desulfococcaceae bacterium OttesenSCG-928-F15]|nr:carbamoyl-phosphate synthase large subunit [Desulfococcaceae bacterium OttesenSCG-928-F15]